MSTTLQNHLWSENWSLADLHRHLGGIPLNRIRGNPAPGGASVQDVAAIQRNSGRLYELIDCILVEKTTGYYESRLAIVIAFFFLNSISASTTLGSYWAPMAHCRFYRIKSAFPTFPSLHGSAFRTANCPRSLSRTWRPILPSRFCPKVIRRQKSHANCETTLRPELL